MRALLMVFICSVTLVAQQPAPATVTNQDLLAGLPSDGSKWLMYHGNYCRPPVQSADADHASERQSAEGAMDVPDTPHTELPDHSAHGRQRAVRHRFQRQQPGRLTRDRAVKSGRIAATCPTTSAGAAGRTTAGSRCTATSSSSERATRFLVALDMKTGDVVWETQLAEYKHGYSATVAPIVVKDKVIIGIAGAEFGIRGFIDAYDVNTGKRAWRFHTVAGPGEPGGQTWPKGSDAYLRGGGSIWVSGTYDPEQNLVFFGTGNPGPDYYSPAREGDNLYTCSAVALDADTGQLKWHFQFTPHDVHDWDSTQVPVLADLTINGTPRKTMLFANRNGFFYVLDRTNGRMISAKPFVTQNWAKEISPEGRPILLPGTNPSEEGSVKVCPDLGGGTNFFSPSYDPTQRLFFVNARETCAIYYSWHEPFRQGEQYESGGTTRPRDQKNYGALRAIDPVTGDRKWEFRYPVTSSSGILTTASGLVFSGDGDGNIIALDSKSGKYLWHYQLGVGLRSTGGTTYMVDGKQYLLFPSGSALTAFALP